MISIGYLQPLVFALKLTERPRRLLAGTVLQEEPPRCLEDEIALHSRQPLELGRESVENARIERRPLCNVRRVRREKAVQIAVRDLRDVIALDILPQLGLISTYAWTWR